MKDLIWKKNKDFMVGSPEIKERDGLTVRQESHVVDKKEKKEEVILLAVQPNQCVIPEKDTKKVQKEYLGKKEIK
jgi:hypothetical protein